MFELCLKVNKTLNLPSVHWIRHSLLSQHLALHRDRCFVLRIVQEKFRTMITIEDEDYVRISLLLLKGGGMVSEEILNREVTKSGESIDESLNNFEKKLKHQFHRKQREVLYPASGATNIKDWDIQMITGVLLTVFKKGLDKEEKEAIGKIKSVRNDIYAHRSLKPLTHSEYEGVQKDLIAALKILSSKLDSKMQQKIEELIKECTASRLDEATVRTILEGISRTEEEAIEILKGIGEVKQKIDGQHEKTREENVEEHVKTRNIIMEELRKFREDKERRNQEINIELDTELTLTGDKEQSEVIEEAEKMIVNGINAVVDDNAESIANSQIMPAISNVIGHINSIPGVEVLHAKPKCIMLTFRCTSYEGLYDLLFYFETEAFRNSISKIVDAVCANLPLKKPIFLSSRLNLESLKKILNSIGEKETYYHSENKEEFQDKINEAIPLVPETYRRTVKLPIKVKRLEGMAKVYDLFENGGATSSFNKVSKTISTHLGAKITLKPSLNVEQVEKELKRAHTNELSKSVFVNKSADYVPSKDTEFEDFDSRETDSYEEEETDETYASPRMKRKRGILGGGSAMIKFSK